ncbi:MAG: DUF63 family protein [Halobacteria archaeon]
MNTTSKRKGVELWWILVLAPFAILAAGLLLKPDLFYDRFIWKYFWGPVVADSRNVAEVVHNGVRAQPGYTLISELGYAYTLILAVLAVVNILEIFDKGNRPRFFYSLVPSVFLGGALRVVEDTGALKPPINYVFISPIIYFTMFILVLAFLLISILLERKGYVDSYSKPLGVLGAAALTVTLAFLVLNGLQRGAIIIWVPVASLALATVSWGVVWFPVEKYSAMIMEGTGWMGAVVLWGHMVDAASTTVGIEYLGYGEKHPLVQGIIDISGTTFTFIPVKIAIVLLILYAFDREFFEEYDKLPYLLLVAVLAVGLGPGTRNLLRATIGV